MILLYNNFESAKCSFCVMIQSSKIMFGHTCSEYPIGNGKALQFVYGSKQVFTQGGILATTATTNLYRSRRFKEAMKDIMSQCCSPDEVIFGPDFHQSLYCHLLCGLIYSDKFSLFSRHLRTASSMHFTLSRRYGKIYVLI